MRSLPTRIGALSLAALLVTTPGCLTWIVAETPVPGTERAEPVTEWQELRPGPWSRLQEGALPIRLELYGSRQPASGPAVTREVELLVISATGGLISNAVTTGGVGNYFVLLIATPFTIVVDLITFLFSAPVAPFTRPADPSGEPIQPSSQAAEKLLEPLPLGTPLTLDWGDGIPRQQVILRDEGMLYLRYGQQARQALAQGRSTARVGVRLDEPALTAQLTLPLQLLIEAAATEIEADDAGDARALWTEILDACPPQAEDVRTAIRARVDATEEAPGGGKK